MSFERNYIVPHIWHPYLLKIINFRKEKRNIVNLDETRINVAVSHTKVWKNITIKRHQKTFKSFIVKQMLEDLDLF